MISLSKIIAFFLFIQVCFSQHICGHDSRQVENPIDIPQAYYEKYNSSDGKRALAAAEARGPAGPLRITFQIVKEMKKKDKVLTISNTERHYLHRLMAGSVEYFEKLIKIKHRTIPIKSIWGYKECSGTPYTSDIASTGPGINNSDIHILVGYEREEQQLRIASAAWCELDPYPIIGEITFNLSRIEVEGSSEWEFQQELSVSLHEIIHILGFSSSLFPYWLDPETSKPYSKEKYSEVVKIATRWGRENSTMIRTPHVLHTAREFFGCPSLEGIFLENDSDELQASHWEKDLLFNDIMVSTIITGPFAISELTLAILRDTGYYTEVNSNMATAHFWGHLKGCEFVDHACNSTRAVFDEFPTASWEDVCDFNALGISYSRQQYLSQCKIVQPTESEICAYNEKLIVAKPTAINFEAVNPHCISLKNSAPKCFHIECDYLQNNELEVRVLTAYNNYATCSHEGQLVRLPTNESIQCPKNFKQICSFPKYCPSHCNQRGFCLKGVCMCFSGQAGKACEKSCQKPFTAVTQSGICAVTCPKGTFKNTDGNCPREGYFPDVVSRECKLCHRSCQQCLDSSAEKCSACTLGHKLVGSRCMSTFCYGVKDCEFCVEEISTSGGISNSKSSPIRCITCKENYSLDRSNKCVAGACHATCLTCYYSNSYQHCSSCHTGFFLQKGQCLPCQHPCKSCERTATMCFSCASEVKFELVNNSCKEKCISPCLTCDQKSNLCASCVPGMFLRNGKCWPCDNQCLTCIEASQKCQSCRQGYELSLSSYSCRMKCHNSCKSCFKPNDQNSCLACRFGQYLYSGSCRQCEHPCRTCQRGKNDCLSCVEGFAISSTSNCAKIQENTPVCSIEWCSKCKNQQTCAACEQGYAVTIKGSCKKCEEKCEVCRFEDKMIGSFCIKCLEKLTLVNGKCLDCTNESEELCRSASTEISMICDNNCLKCSGIACIECAEGFNLDGEQFVCSSKHNHTCHYSCETCIEDNSGGSYFQCTSCKEPFSLQKTALSLDSGICECSSGESSLCEAGPAQYLLKISTIGSLAISSALSTATSVFKGKPQASLLQLLLFTQSIRYLGYMNFRVAIGIDAILIRLVGAMWQGQTLGMFEVGDQQLLEDRSVSFNPKMRIPGGRQLFFINNSLTILVGSGVFWLVMKYMWKRRCSSGSNGQQREGVQLWFIALTSSELFILAIFQAQVLHVDERYGFANCIAATVTMAYVGVSIMYLLRNIRNQQKQKQYEEKIVQDEDISLTFTVAFIVKNILNSLTSTLLFESPLKQACLFLSTSILYIAFLMLSKDTQGKLNKVAALCEVPGFIIEAIYLGMIVKENENTVEECSFAIGVVITLSLAIIAGYSLVEFIKFIMRKNRSKSSSKSKQDLKEAESLREVHPPWMRNVVLEESRITNLSRRSRESNEEILSAAAAATAIAAATGDLIEEEQPTHFIKSPAAIYTKSLFYVMNSNRKAS